MSHESVAILGGSGFVGSHLTARLAGNGHTVRILSRHRGGRHHHPLPSGAQMIDYDAADLESVSTAIDGCSVVINLVGILNERGHDGRGFHQAHVEMVQRVVSACRRKGVERLLHMCALGADAKSGTSHYLRTKGEAEEYVHASGLKVTSFRPSVIFGKGDSFLTRFAKLLAIPGPFPLACATARFAPVWVEDVVSCYAHAITDPQTIGQRYELCGPKEYTLEELVRYIAQLLGKRKWIIPLGDSLSAVQAQVLEFVPGKPFTRDNFNTMRTPNVCAAEFPAIFGITPRALESVAPEYLGRHRR